MQWAEIGGRQRLLVGGHVNKFIPNPLFDPVAKPGCLYLYFKGENPEQQGHPRRRSASSSRSTPSTATATRACR